MSNWMSNWFEKHLFEIALLALILWGIGIWLYELPVPKVGGFSRLFYKLFTPS